MHAAAERLVVTERAQEVVVPLGARAYSVVVGTGVLSSVGPRLAALGFKGKCGLVTSERVGALYREPVLASLRDAGFTPTVVELPDGEEHKNLAWLTILYDRFLDAGLDRRSPLVALGGGVIGDLTGFAAATLLRGLPFVQVPTTLLAQVDAAIGGKTGVNHVKGKNLIGVFNQPQFVLSDVDVLRTLPPRELAAGMAEVIKYGVIGDAALFTDLEQQIEAAMGLEPSVTVSLVVRCAAQKAAVVAADEREERGERAVLNFGHTVGHAVEVLTEYRQFLHGEAVAIGMVAAARVSQRLGTCGADVVARIERLLKRAGLPTEIPKELRSPALALAMQADKKSTGGRIRFVAVEVIGRTRFVDLAATEIVQRL